MNNIARLSFISLLTAVFIIAQAVNGYITIEKNKDLRREVSSLKAQNDSIKVQNDTLLNYSKRNEIAVRKSEKRELSQTEKIDSILYLRQIPFKSNETFEEKLERLNSEISKNTNTLSRINPNISNKKWLILNTKTDTIETEKGVDKVSNINHLKVEEAFQSILQFQLSYKLPIYNFQIYIKEMPKNILTYLRKPNGELLVCLISQGTNEQIIQANQKIYSGEYELIIYSPKYIEDINSKLLFAVDGKPI